VFLRAFERFSTLGPSPSAPGWLKTVATNLCLNHLSRYRARWQFFSELDQTGESGTLAFADSIPAVMVEDDEARRFDEDARLEVALQRLPDHQRVPLVLFHFNEQSYQDIAKALGVSLAKVKTDIHRGREALKKYL
jgi:RNA polymerase sigma-70 factor (ECF subfamily)